MSTSAKTRAAMAQDTTARLIAVARASFAAIGFNATSLDVVAAEAGVTRGAVHHHFTNKTGLFEAVLRQIDAELGAEIQLIWDAEPDHWAGFRRCFHGYLDAILRPDRRRIMFLDAPAVLGVKGIDILMDSGFGAIVDELQRMILDGRVVTVDAVAMAHLINGATINLAFWVAESSMGEDRITRAHTTLAAMFDGFTASG